MTIIVAFLPVLAQTSARFPLGDTIKTHCCLNFTLGTTEHYVGKQEAADKLWPLTADVVSVDTDGDVL